MKSKTRGKGERNVRDRSLKSTLDKFRDGPRVPNVSTRTFKFYRTRFDEPT